MQTAKSPESLATDALVMHTVRQKGSGKKFLIFIIIGFQTGHINKECSLLQLYMTHKFIAEFFSSLFCIEFPLT